MTDKAVDILGGILGLFVIAAFAIGLYGGDPTILTELFKVVFTIGVFCVLVLGFAEAVTS